jgi:hypothetical protein
MVKARRVAALLLAALVGAAAATAPAHADRASEEAVKAAFLYHFARFVQWPAAAEARHPGLFVVAVLGKGELATSVERTLHGKMVAERRVEVRRVGTAEEARDAHILLVGDGVPLPPAAIGQAVAGSGVLTVGDTRGFAEKGGMINFVVRDQKVRFEVNLDRAHAEHLRISSQLLKLATLVPARERE